MTPKNSMVVLIILLLQMSPVLIYESRPKTAKWEQDLFANEFKKCFDSNLAESVNIYKKQERENPGSVHGGVEGVISGYTPIYTKMCREMVELKFFSPSYFLLSIIFAFYVLPSSLLSTKILLRIDKQSIKRIQVFKIGVLVVGSTLFGIILVWSLCLPALYKLNIKQALGL